jgi:hypothetical protein
MWLIYLYVMASIVLSISAWVRAGFMVGAALAAGSVLAVAVGAGLRASLLGPTKQKVWGSVIAALLFALALWVGTHFSATVFGVYVSGPLWVVIGVVVCFLFVNKKMLREPPQMSTQEALQIFDAYGDAMAKPPFNTPTGKGPVRDLRALPYPKERIKQALLTLLTRTPPGAEREPLKNLDTRRSATGRTPARATPLRPCLLNARRFWLSFGPLGSNRRLLRAVPRARHLPLRSITAYLSRRRSRGWSGGVRRSLHWHAGCAARIAARRWPKS